MPSVLNKIAKRWSNAFSTYEAKPQVLTYSVGPSSSSRPHTPPRRFSNERTIISSIYTRMGTDFAGIELRHVKVDAQNRYMKDIDSDLARCFSFEANLDQAPRAWRQDIAITLFDEGVAALVPVDYTTDENGNLVDIQTLRVGRIVDWLPKHVRVAVYNEAKGQRDEIVLEKRKVGIVENPFYAVMNEQNSTLQRLIRKLSLLDVVDEQSSSGKLDIMIQLPYAIKTESKRQMAEKRREDIEFQLKDSQYGIAYVDGTEKITQLNRPSENNLLKQVDYLTNLLYEQLGLTKTIMDGTADEATMINYTNRTIEPLLAATTEAMQRVFLGIPGWERKERIKYFRNPFQLVPVSELAEIADKFTRNEIFSSNEIRGFMGVAPSTDPKADELRNSNMPQSELGVVTPAEVPAAPAGPSFEEVESLATDVFDGLSADLDKIAGGS